MDFKENVNKFSAFWPCSAGQLFGLRGPDLACRLLIEEPCSKPCKLLLLLTVTTYKLET